MKRAQLRIQHLTGRQSPYRIDVPASISETGRRHRVHFKTKGQAQAYRAALQQKAQEQGIAAILIPPRIKRQVVDAQDMLGDVELIDAITEWHEARAILDGRIDLRGACQRFADAQIEREASKPLGEVIELFGAAPTAKTRRPKSAKYRSQIRSLANHLTDLVPVPVCDIDAESIERALADISARSRHGYSVVLKSVLNFAVRKGWSAKNPMIAVDVMRHDRPDAIVPTLAQARALLDAASGDAQVAYVALCLFAGLRDSEATRLDWQDIRWDIGEIHLPAAPGRKAASGRFLPMEDNLRAWLEPIRQDAGTICLGITFAAMKSVRRDADATLPDNEATLADGWQRDMMRHGAASAWAAVHGITKACGWLGHSEQVHRQHYRRPMAQADAQAWFSIQPKGDR